MSASAKPSDPAPPNGRRTAVARATLAALAALIAMAVFGGGLVAWLSGTEPGRQRLAAWLTDLASDPDQVITIGRIGPGLPGRIVIEGLGVGDGAGTWLTLERIEATWRPLSLLSGAIGIDDVAAAGLRVRRAPEPGEGTEGDTLLPDVPPVALRIGRARLTDARLDAPVLGFPVSFGAEFSSAVTASGDVRIAMTVERSDGVPARLAGTVSLDAAEKRLSVELDAREPAGGVLAGLLALPGRPPFEATVSGAGPLDDWHGRAAAGFDGGPALELALRLETAPGGYRIGARGTADVATLVPPARRPLLAPLAIDVSGVMPGALDRLVLGRAIGENALARVDVGGTIDWDAGRLDLDVAGRLLDADRLAAVADGLSVPDLTVVGHVAGPLDGPGVDLRVSASRAAAAGLAAEAPSLQVTMPTRSGPGPRPVALSFRTAALGGAALDAAAGLFPATVAATASGVLAADGSVLRIERAALETPWARGDGSGTVGLVTGEAAITGRLAVADLAPLSQVAGLPLAGSAAVTLDAASTAPDAVWRGNLSIAFEALDTGIAGLGPLVGTTPRASTGFVFDPNRTLVAETVRLAAAGLTAEGRVSAPADLATVEAEATVWVADLAATSALSTVEVSGAAALALRLQGAMTDPGLGATLSAERLTVAGQSFPALTARVRLSGLVSGPTGTVSAEGRGPIGRLEAKAGVAMTAGDRLTVRDLDLRTAGARLAGSVDLDTRRGLADGTVRMDWPALASLNDPLGHAIGGRAAGKVRLTARGGRQQATFDLALRDGAVDGATLADFSAEGRLDLASPVPHLTATVTARNGRRGAVMLDTLMVRVSGTAGDLAATADIEGRAAGPIRLALAGRGGQAADGAVHLTIDRLTGMMDRIPLGLAQPIQLAITEGRVERMAGALTLGDGRLTARSEPAAGGIRLVLGGAALPVSAVTALTGRLPVDGDVDGDLSAETDRHGLARARLTLTEARLRPTLGGPDRPTARLMAMVRLDRRRIDADGHLDGPWATPLRFAAGVPVTDPGTAAIAVPAADAPLDGQVSWQGELAALLPFLPAGALDVAGRIDADLRLGGTLAAPAATGRASLSHGRIEHLETGALVAGLEVAVRADADRRMTVTLSGHDGTDGRIGGTGTVRLAERGIDAEARLELERFTVARRDDLRAKATGDLDFAGTVPGGRVSGRMVLEPVEAFLMDSLPPSVPTLDVVEAGSKPPAAAGPEGPAGAAALALDVTIEVPRRAFVKGRGLDTEWAGTVHIGGTAAAPAMSGGIHVVRGTASVLGRSFTVSEGTVTLSGGALEPQFHIVAVHERRGLEVTAVVSGTPRTPVITLRSRPALPEDEVAAALLFDKKADQLSPAEAVQLAESLATLTGAGGPGLTDRVREKLGLDLLTTESGPDGPRLKAGKYATDKVFVGVGSSAAAGSGRANIEVEMTPQVSVESEIGQDARGDVGIVWKYRY